MKKLAITTIVSLLLFGLLIALAIFALPMCQEKRRLVRHSGPTGIVENAPPSILPHSAGPPNDPIEAQTKMNLLYLTPISFYGRVVDQNGNPVEGAKINFSANTVPWGRGEKFSTKSDGGGNFGISGIHGRSLFVRVSKEGCYQMPGTESMAGSSGDFDFGSDLGKGMHSPSKSSPVVFMLRKAGTLEPLIARKGLRVPLQPDGTVYPVSLRRSQGAENRIRLSCRSERMPESGGAFNWSYEVTFENGELIERTDEFDFEAPTNGYQQTDSGVMSKSLPGNQWKDRVVRNFFIRFQDGTYARVALEIHAGAKPFVTLDSYLNPKPGSRNLEAGPPVQPGR